MGRVASSLIKRPWMNWNAENRAIRELERQEKPKTAPRHQSSREYIDKYSQEHPEILEEQKQKNLDLAKNLEGLIVEPDKFGEIKSSKKPLPENRSMVPDMEFGYLEPEVIRPGRCSIKQAMQFLGDYYTDPEKNDINVIAKQYNLSKDQVSRVLRYFSVFLIQIPGQKTSRLDTILDAKALKANITKKLTTGTQNSKTDKVS